MEKKKVFCIGLSRTGTTSLCQALEILGYKTLHFPLQLFIHPEIISEELHFEPQGNLNLFWRWRLKKELEVFNLKFDPEILEKYDAFGDLPIPLFYKKLDKKFPGSKFIYTYRNEKKWLSSMKWLYDDGAVQWSHGLLNDEIKLAVYGTAVYNDAILIESYRKHHHQVFQFFKKRKKDLLMLNIDEETLNFKVLGSFLDREIPELEFPKTNMRRVISQKKRVNYWLSRKVPFYGLIENKIQR